MNRATKITVATFGSIMGLAGIEHGIGEILQGSTAPNGIMFPSWPDAAFFRVVSGEPAMSIIPNLLITGILAILFSLAYIYSAIFSVQRKSGGLGLILLAVAMLLFGGGIFPPILGMGIGVLRVKVNSPNNWWRTHLTSKFADILKTAWSYIFVACLIGWLALFPGINLLGTYLGVDNPTLTVAIIGFALSSLVLTALSGIARDIHPAAEV
ncbi:MAG: hypothetical protein M1281_16255 [Chloroflexi bacterium]|nr:hypothetical protein [Chloroflexota bacterium]